MVCVKGLLLSYPRALTGPPTHTSVLGRVGTRALHSGFCRPRTFMEVQGAVTARLA